MKSNYAESIPINWTLARRMAHELALAGKSITSGAFWTVMALLTLLVTWPALIYLIVRVLIGS